MMSWKPPPSFVPLTPTRKDFPVVLTVNSDEEDQLIPVVSPHTPVSTKSNRSPSGEKSYCVHNISPASISSSSSAKSPPATTTPKTMKKKEGYPPSPYCSSMRNRAAEKPARQESPPPQGNRPTISNNGFVNNVKGDLDVPSIKSSTSPSLLSHQTPKRSWQPSSASVFVPTSFSSKMDNEQDLHLHHQHSSNSNSNNDGETELEQKSHGRSSTTNANAADLVETTMLQTRLEWNQRIVNKSFLPYTSMIRSLDPDNFPEDGPLDDDGSKKGDYDHNNSMMGLLVDWKEGENDDFYLLYDSTNGGLDGSSHGPPKDIRGIMMKDTNLSEREIAAFFEGMSFFRTKINCLQSQLEALKVVNRQRRTGSMVFLPPSSRQQKEDTRICTTGNTTCPAEPSLRSVSMMPSPTFQKTPFGGNSGRKTGEPPRPRPFDKSIRTMSIAKARSTVETMVDRAPVRTSMLPQNGLPTPTGITRTKGDLQELLNELEAAMKKQMKLEKQLRQAGVTIAEDIPYDFAKEKVNWIAQRMAEIGGSDVDDPALREEYFRLEQDMEKYTSALQLTDEWEKEQEELEHQWEQSITSANEEALLKVRRHMPVDVKNISEAALSSLPTPNGKFLPKATAKKFKRTNCLQLLRTDPDEILRMHPSTLENMRVTGLTLTERRALYCHLKPLGPKWKAMISDKMTERKWNWFNMMKVNFKEKLDVWQRHVDQYGHPDHHLYATKEDPDGGCPLLGKQCPIKADSVIDYSGDYGYPDAAVYHKSVVTKSEVDNTDKATEDAMDVVKEKKAGERREALRSHYKGNIQKISLSVGSCESMEALLDTLEAAQEKMVQSRLDQVSDASEVDRHGACMNEVAVFDETLKEVRLLIISLVERSGIQAAGRRDTGEEKTDPRSLLEMCLSEEVTESVNYLFSGIQERMSQMRIKDGRIKSMIEQIQGLLKELQIRNSQGIPDLLGSEKRPPHSRKRRTREAIEADIKRQQQSHQSPVNQMGEDGPPSEVTRGPSAGRNALLDAVKARGTANDAATGSGPSAGRNALLDAVKARGTANNTTKGSGPNAGRNALMDALKANGGARGGGPLGGGPGGHGGLLAAIAARGKID